MIGGLTLEKVDVMTLLTQLDEKIDKARPAWFGNGKCCIDKEELLQYIEDIRMGLPEEIKHSQWIISERDNIMAEAKKRSDEMLRQTEEKIVAMVNEHEVTQRAYEQAQVIMTEANEYRAKTITETHQYCDELLGKMEGDMIGVVDLIRQSRAAIHNQ